MTLRSAGLAVAVGSPMFALYILGVLLLLDLESLSGQYALAMPVALFLGFVPWGFLINQVVASGQLPDRKSTSGWLSGLIAVLDSGKGALAVTLGWAAIDTSEGTMAAGLAVLAGHTAASLVFRHGRAGPVSVGGLLVMAWLPGTIAVASVPLAILAVRRGLPGGVLVAGFQLSDAYLQLHVYDALAERNRLALEARYSTWQGAPFDGGDYAVSVHRADATTVDG